MSAADLHRARQIIAQSDATIEQRLIDIHRQASELSIRITHAVIAALDVLDMSREQAGQGAEIVSPADALLLFDLANTLMHTADRAALQAEAALLEARERLARQAANERQAA